MDLVNNLATYNKLTDALLDALQKSFDEGYVHNRLDEFQHKLDLLARRYRDDPKMGSDRYKLYEAQASIWFFWGDYEQALQFLDEAENIKGSALAGGGSLRSAISSAQAAGPVHVHDSAETAKKLPLKGWTAFFVVGLYVGVAYNLYQSFTGWDTLTSLTPAVKASYPGIERLFIVEQTVPIIMVFLCLITIYLFHTRKRLGKYIGIIYLCLGIAYSIFDIASLNSVFAINREALAAASSETTKNGRNIIVSFVWVLYLLFSRQITRVLAKD